MSTVNVTTVRAVCTDSWNPPTISDGDEVIIEINEIRRLLVVRIIQGRKAFNFVVNERQSKGLISSFVRYFRSWIHR